MKAAVLRDVRDLSIKDIEAPEPGPGQVLVRVKATAICGTDLGIYTGKSRANLPLVPGHESSGTVVALGPGARGVSVGDRVVLNPLLFCLRCPYCLAGKPNLCLNGGLMGREAPGTFAEFVAVEDYRCHRLPETVGFNDATSLVVLSTVLAGHRQITIRPGTSVAVVGLGSAGILHTQLAKASGAYPVFGVSRSAWKLELARRRGADVTIGGGDVVREVLKHTDGLGVDVAIECAGKAETLRQAMEMTRPGGTVLAFGILPSHLGDFDGFDLYYKELTVVGTRAMLPEDFEGAIRATERGLIDLDSIVTHTYSLDELKAAFDKVETSPGDVLRVVVEI
ncbi:MAG: zinc-dependent alcohol dehydrogenase [Betaproteobacteria bacterium]